MKITFNANESFAEVHNLGFMATCLVFASFIFGVSYWIIAAVMFFNTSYL
jgi:hypothetical protein